MLHNASPNSAEKVIFGDALQVDVGGDELIRRVIGVRKALEELMLQRRFANPPLAVQQETVVRQRPFDVGDEITSAVEEIRPNDSTGDVGIKLLGDGTLRLAAYTEPVRGKQQCQEHPAPMG